MMRAIALQWSVAHAVVVFCGMLAAAYVSDLWLGGVGFFVAWAVAMLFYAASLFPFVRRKPEWDWFSGPVAFWAAFTVWQYLRPAREQERAIDDPMVAYAFMLGLTLVAVAIEAVVRWITRRGRPLRRRD